MKLLHAIGRYLIFRSTYRSVRSPYHDTLGDPKAVRKMRLPADAYEADWPPLRSPRAQQVSK
jgi:hypothetical protein